MKKKKEILESTKNEVIQKIKKEKLKIGLINVCTLAAKNKNIDKKADIKELFDEDNFVGAMIIKFYLSIAVCSILVGVIVFWVVWTVRTGGGGFG